MMNFCCEEEHYYSSSGEEHHGPGGVHASASFSFSSGLGLIGGGGVLKINLVLNGYTGA